MRITSWNLLHGLAMPPRESAATTEELAQSLAVSVKKLNPDVIGVQEVDYYLARSGNINQVANVAAALGARDWAFAPSVIGSPEADWIGTNAAHKRIVTNKDSQADPQFRAAAGYGIGMVSTLPVKSWHRVELRRSPVGVFMTFPVNGKMTKVYVQDHPRSALACVLENGWMIINTHLSFVPGVNIFQIAKIKRWIKKLPVKNKQKILIMGDMNLPWDGLIKGLNWNSVAKQKTYPSWNPKLQLDYFLSLKVASEDVQHQIPIHDGMSDHLPLTIDVDVD
ncbi:MAG: endonuclease/exonuclease/phosphatase family protein [Actinobacteria bacterium]|nr:endonuclease/exonuclease/phosphatase family protein [Actinomycetota bacterium]